MMNLNINVNPLFFVCMTLFFGQLSLAEESKNICDFKHMKVVKVEESVYVKIEGVRKELSELNDYQRHRYESEKVTEVDVLLFNLDYRMSLIINSKNDPYELIKYFKSEGIKSQHFDFRLLSINYCNFIRNNWVVMRNSPIYTENLDQTPVDKYLTSAGHLSQVALFEKSGPRSVEEYENVSFTGVYSHFDLPNFKEVSHITSKIFNEFNLNKRSHEKFMLDYYDLMASMYHTAVTNSLAMPFIP